MQDTATGRKLNIEVSAGSGAVDLLVKVFGLQVGRIVASRDEAVELAKALLDAADVKFKLIVK